MEDTFGFFEGSLSSGPNSSNVAKAAHFHRDGRADATFHFIVTNSILNNQQINSTTMTINQPHMRTIRGLLKGGKSLRLTCGSVLTKRGDGSIVLLSADADAEVNVDLLTRIVTQRFVAVAVSRRL